MIISLRIVSLELRISSELLNRYLFWQNKAQMANSLQQYRLVVGMHSVYLAVRSIDDASRGNSGFYAALVYFTAIYLPVLKRVIRYFEITKIIVSGLHRYFCITSVAFPNRVLVKVSARSSP